MGTMELGGTPEESADRIDEIVTGSGVVLVRAGDPEAFAIEFTDRLDAELLDSPDELDVALRSLRDAVDARTGALAALEIHARQQAASQADGHHEVTDLEALRRLVSRLHDAERLVERSRRAATDRLGSGTGMAVHPDALRAAAAEVRNERAAVAELDAEIAELEAVVPDDADEPADEPDGETVGARPAEEPVRSWDDGERRSMVRAAVVAVVALVVAVGLYVTSSTVVGFAVPVLVAAWMVASYRRYQRNLDAYDVASENLAAVAALTDQAYGGVVESRSPELLALDRRRHDAMDRLRYAESRWVGLVGTEVDADSVDEWLATRVPNHRIGESELAQTPSVRAASAQFRRLMAQWKLAWYVLDRAVPSLDDAEASLDALSAEGIDRLRVPTHERRSTGGSDDDAGFSELAGDRSVDDLRAAAAVTPRPLVVLDLDGEMASGELEERADGLPPDARIVVVGPPAGDAGEDVAPERWS